MTGIVSSVLMGLCLVSMVLMVTEGGSRWKHSCDCNLHYRRHWDQAMSLVMTVVCSAMVVCDMLGAVLLTNTVSRVLALLGVAIYGFWVWFYHRQWKRHKGNKKGALGKLLARVKLTEAGLKVVPVPLRRQVAERYWREANHNRAVGRARRWDT